MARSSTGSPPSQVGRLSRLATTPRSATFKTGSIAIVSRPRPGPQPDADLRRQARLLRGQESVSILARPGGAGPPEGAMAIRVSCHGITWGRDGLQQAVEDLQTLGFHGFEAFAFVVDDYGFDRLSEFKALLAGHDLNLVALYGGGNMHDATVHGELVERNARFARFLAANGATRLVLGPGRRPAGGPTRDQLLNQIQCANEIGRRSLEYGVLACVHPHISTAIEKLAEIDFVMDRVDPRYVAMAADTAHLRKGNPDSPTAEIDVFRRYAERIKYVHLKDWDPRLPPVAAGDGG